MKRSLVADATMAAIFCCIANKAREHCAPTIPSEILLLHMQQRIRLFAASASAHPRDADGNALFSRRRRLARALPSLGHTNA